MSLEAPFTEEEVRKLNEFQQCGYVHPFTCGDSECREILTATNAGWVCKKCGYVQNWAHDFMVEQNWTGKE